MKKKLMVISVMLAFLVSGCAGIDIMGIGTGQPDEMSLKEQATVWMSIYNAQYDDYKATVKRGGLTEDQRRVLRVKKQILTVAWDLLKTYAEYADSGVMPSREFEAHLTNIINQISLGGFQWLLKF